MVGIGASAGGLEAFLQLLSALPPESGMAFILVPHLDPTHESAMSELLSRSTQMPVSDVNDGMWVAANRVYVIRPNTEMTIAKGILRLKSRGQARKHYMPIDIFLRSLAEDQKNNAIGVILSGTASDGTQGLTAIKGGGGITFAQEPRTAKYEGMPRSAIMAGCVDFVMSPEEIAKELMRIRRHPFVTESRAEDAPEIDLSHQTQMERTFRMLRERSGVDFTEYKRGTIRRRILRRMALRQCDKLGDYLRYLTQHRQEVEALYEDLLINVTNFFRNPDAFEALKETVYPAILKGRKPGDTVRIWVPGCSTGEEAYSHAMTLLEFMGETRGGTFPIQIFGTDLSEKSIQKARAGIYKESIRTDVSPGRFRRFFTPVEGAYQISKNIRDLCVFATQNVFMDPPFSHMDIVSCRNVLIYMSAPLQQRILPILHYALKPGGFLMVGNNEGLMGAGAELFDVANRKHKIYSKLDVATPVMQRFRVDHEHTEPAAKRTEAALGMGRRSHVETPFELQREADRLLLAKYVPAAVVVSDNMEIQQTRGHTSRYLELPAGRASLNLMKMVQPGLLFELQHATRQAQKEGVPIKKKNILVDQNGHTAMVDIDVVPFKTHTNHRQSFLIVFEEAALPEERRKGNEKEKKKKTQLEEEGQLKRLKQELAATKDYVQASLEAQEASNEELQSANEEIQSSNEELQSTNEELQTSKEELESANEELNTVNEEMSHRNVQLTQANNDIRNFLTSVNIPMVMLGSDYTIRRYTPMAENVLGLTPNDVGRPITNLRLIMQLPDLETSLNEVIGEVRTKQLEVRDHAGTWYRLRITPYRTAENAIEGAVLSLVDITDLKRSLDDLATSQANLIEIIRQMQSGLVVAEAPSGKVQLVNDALRGMLGEKASGQASIYDYARQVVKPDGRPINPDAWAIARAMKGEVVTVEEIEWLREDGKHLFLNISAAPIRDDAGRITGVVGTFFDLTYRRSTEEMLRTSEQMAATGRLSAALAHEINNPLEAMTNIFYLLGSQTTLTEQDRRFVDMAHAELGRIIHISKSLLGLYRGEAKNEPFFVRDAINEVLDAYASRIAAAKIQVVKRYEAVAKLHGSYTEIRQIFLNLIGNALEAMKPGGRLTIRTSPSRDWHDLGVRGIRISVLDSGSGIPKEHRHRIFEPFFTTKGKKGTGLGLWVTAGIAHRYGGGIRVRSRTNAGRSGSCFSVFLPSPTVSRDKGQQQ
jgi:two-component system CheB/CheR fusion protein